MTKYDRYLRIVKWARERYAYEGNLVISVGGKPTAYSRIEKAAAVKFLGA